MSAPPPLLHPQWYRVAELRPRPRAGVRMALQRVRGETWHVLTDPVTGRHHRFNRSAYALLVACNGERSLDAVWTRRVEAAGDDAPTQGEAIDVLARAFEANLLVADVPPDARALLRLRERRRRQRRRSRINPLAFRVPLWDPDAFLSAHAHRLQWLYGLSGTRVAGLLALASLLLLLVHGGDLARAGGEVIGQSRFLLLLWLAYPLVKAAHELAHGFAVRCYGGEVHEMGVTLMLLTPVPYVDASASAAFENRRRRIVVGSAGIGAELLLAGVALLAWLALEPGLLRDAALAVVAIGGLSTLLVNGNPLLRFDGYHVLCDALGLPNLGQRSSRRWQWRLKRLLGVPAADPAPPHDRGERLWLLFYAPASWLYRTLLLLGLAVWLASQVPWLGLALLAFAVWLQAVKPVAAVLRWAATAAELGGRRPRATLAAAGLTLALLLLVFALPLPHRSLAPGLVWLPDEALVRPATDGELVAVLAREGDLVEPGTPLLRLENEALRLELRRVASALAQEEVQRLGSFGSDALRSGLAADRAAALMRERDQLQARVDALEVRAGAAGRVALDPRHLVPGRHLAQGAVAAHVLPAGATRVRAWVAHADMATVRAHPGPIHVELVGGGTLPATLQRVVPQASTRLPSAALGEPAGGAIAIDLRDARGLTALEPRFELELLLPEAVATARVGARARVTFDHGWATAATLAAQFLRSAFLRHFER
ncbi:biotin/lipoyl-binding protein [Pseudorhodoferax sp.]|uniref:biotin/lipoyl-binding protein n=1 Tax=Pseudorhodoferax sp. TaxID=1993553 RepID=UPI002DD62BA3|nr:biotin/lipoyl-binding protein [Pseudorhodoferax sp.]